jgi:hypothetical protein
MNRCTGLAGRCGYNIVLANGAVLSLLAPLDLCPWIIDDGDDVSNRLDVVHERSNTVSSLRNSHYQ